MDRQRPFQKLLGEYCDETRRMAMDAEVVEEDVGSEALLVLAVG